MGEMHHGYTQDLVLGSVTYELRVREDHGGHFYGTCFCRTCWEGRVRYEMRATAEEALDDAVGFANQHHDEVHAPQI
jgi:hypothetical protein